MGDGNATRSPDDSGAPVDSESRLDELLADPPAGYDRGGGFAGYEAARKVRRLLVVAMAGVAVLAIGVYFYLVDRQRHLLLHPLEDVEALLDPASPREMTWSAGKARLGLAREAPAVEVIHLPDRDIRLAEGCDRAQVKLEVRDGKTRVVRAILGEVVELEPGTLTPLRQP